MPGLPLLLLMLVWMGTASASGYHGPRTLRPQTPFMGIREIDDAKPVSPDSRRWVHSVDHPRLKMEYDIVLQEGVHSLDEDLNVMHVTCHNDKATLDLHVTDVHEMVQRLQSSKFLVGHGGWGCRR